MGMSGVAIRANGARIDDFDYLGYVERSVDPSAISNQVITYGKDAAGITQLFARSSDGTVHQLTPASAMNNTLDQAYDQGGPGAGRTITADADAVVINNAVADGTNALEVNRTVGTGRAIVATGGITVSIGTMQVASGSAAVPAYTFTGDLDTGIFGSAANTIGFSTGGVSRATISTTVITSTLILQGPAGTAALPTYSFTGDTNTGVFSAAADLLGFAVGGIFQVSIGLAATLSIVPYHTLVGSAAAPAFSFFTDTDTGMFSSAANTVDFTVAGTSRVSISTGNVSSTLVILGPVGSAAAPTFSFTVDGNTGMFASAADTLNFSTAGSSRAQFTSTGLFQLVVTGTAAAPVISFVGDGNSGIFSAGADTYAFATAGVERARYTATGEYHLVAGGTAAAPAIALTGDTNTGIAWTAADTLVLSTAGTARVTVNTTDVTSTLVFFAPAGAAAAPSYAFSTDTDTGMFSSGADQIAWTVGGAVTRLLLTVGNLSSVVTSLWPLGSAAAPAYSISGDTNTGMFSSGADVFNVATAGVERARWTATGEYHLVAGGTAAAPAIALTGDTNTGIAWTAADTLVLSTAGTARITISAAGKVTIPGVIDPTALELSGSTDMYFQSANGNTAAVSALNEGRIRYNSATQTWQMSANGAAYADVATGAGSGWTDDGTNVRLTTATDTVSIGVASPAAATRVQITNAGATTDVVLRIAGIASQSAAYLRVQNSAGGSVMDLSPVSVGTVLTLTGPVVLGPTPAAATTGYLYQNGSVLQWHDSVAARAAAMLESDQNFTGIKNFRHVNIDQTQPSVIGANQNNYTGVVGFSAARISSSGAFNITGFDASANSNGWVMTLVNTGANDITLTNQDVASTAANRIITGTGGNLVMPADAKVHMWYDAGASRWRVLFSTGATGTGTAIVQGGNSFGAAATVGTNDANTFSIETNNVARVTVGSAGNLDIVSGDFQIGSTVVFEADRDLAVSIVPNADATLSVGSSSRRLVSVSAAQFQVFLAPGDANSAVLVSSSGIDFGAGGASATDMGVTRTSASIMSATPEIFRAGSSAALARFRLRGFYAASPADPPASETDIIVVDTGAAQVLRVRYNDAGTMRVGDLALV